jgi:hypothetical protein
MLLNWFLWKLEPAARMDATCMLQLYTPSVRLIYLEANQDETSGFKRYKKGEAQAVLSTVSSPRLPVAILLYRLISLCSGNASTATAALYKKVQALSIHGRTSPDMCR